MRFDFYFILSFLIFFLPRWKSPPLESPNLKVTVRPGMVLCASQEVSRRRGHRLHDDRPFIVLTETKPSKRHIPVWARYSPLRTRVEAHANTLSP